MNVELLLFGGAGLVLILLILAIGIWSEMDSKPRPPAYPPSDEDEIRRYLSGKMNKGGENVQKEEKEKDSESAKGSPRADD